MSDKDQLTQIISEWERSTGQTIPASQIEWMFSTLKRYREALETIRQNFCTPNEEGNGCAGEDKCAGNIAASALRTDEERARIKEINNQLWGRSREE